MDLKIGPCLRISRLYLWPFEKPLAVERIENEPIALSGNTVLLDVTISEQVDVGRMLRRRDVSLRSNEYLVHSRHDALPQFEKVTETGECTELLEKPCLFKS